MFSPMPARAGSATPGMWSRSSRQLYCATSRSPSHAPQVTSSNPSWNQAMSRSICPAVRSKEIARSRAHSARSSRVSDRYSTFRSLWRAGRPRTRGLVHAVIGHRGPRLGGASPSTARDDQARRWTARPRCRGAGGRRSRRVPAVGTRGIQARGNPRARHRPSQPDLYRAHDDRREAAEDQRVRLRRGRRPDRRADARGLIARFLGARREPRHAEIQLAVGVDMGQTRVSWLACCGADGRGLLGIPATPRLQRPS